MEYFQAVAPHRAAKIEGEHVDSPPIPTKVTIGPNLAVLKSIMA